MILAFTLYYSFSACVVHQTAVKFCAFAGGRLGDGNEDQREWPVGRRVQGQERPLPVHTRPPARPATA